MSYHPISEFGSTQNVSHDIFALGQAAAQLYEQSIFTIQGDAQQLLSTLAMVGSSGGARPKAQVFMSGGDTTTCSVYPRPGDEAWLVRFTSASLPLGHEEGLCEAVYLKMAADAGCQPPEWQLLNIPRNMQKAGAMACLAVKRFDYVAQGGAIPIA